MAKNRRAVSLDPEIDEYLGREGVNASQLVNKLVKRHMNGGGSEDEIREFRIRQVRSELEELTSRLDRKETELQRLEERRQRDEEEDKEKQHKGCVELLEMMERTGKYVFADHEDVAELAREHFDNNREEALKTLMEVNEKENFGMEEKRFGK